MAPVTRATAELQRSKPEAKITLYWLEKSRSQRILWLLEELEIPYEIKTFKRGKDMLADPELKKVHPLGKSPVITVEGPGATKPLVLAESGLIVEYLIEYFGPQMTPTKFVEGKEGQIGGETESWLRNRYYHHYAEGSLMSFLLMALLVSGIKKAPVPFFIKPITNMITSRIDSMYLTPNFKTHFAFLESQIESAPDGGPYLCGKQLTGADILMVFPLQAAQSRAGLAENEYPQLCAYLDRLQKREAYERAEAKVREIDPSYTAAL